VEEVRTDAATTEADLSFMGRAVELAARGLGLAAPNPIVGAVVVAGGRIVGEGWHEGPGTPHAEVVALRRAADRASGATLFVTLEPCSHQGRTPPCAPAVVDSGVARVVVGIPDPNPVVDGRGLQLLRRSGIQVDLGVLAREARELIMGFARHVRTGLPFVTLKMAASLDGRVGARDGSSRWLTGPAARQDVHRLRAGSGAVLVGAGTAAADDPALTVRIDGYRGRQPFRVVADGRGRLGAGGALFDGSARVLVATTPAAPPRRRAEWEAAGAEVLILDDPGDGPGGEPAVPLPRLVEALGKRDVQALLIEGGPTLAWSAVAAGVVDRLVLYLAPKLVGGVDAPGVLGGDGIPGIDRAVPLAIRSVSRIGEDLKIVADLRPAEEA
jgi:diaminohydroxyphosphoribosylaminopyrimidine deaminase/5-amino-6-(5-phosphoribosylamino)uracil reductase